MIKIPILVVDDEEGVRRSVKKTLEREGFYRVEAVEDGSKALELFSRDRFEVVICDLKMPGMNGLDVLKEMGTLKPSSVRMVLTGYGTLEHAIKAIDDGIDGFLLKPFDVADLRKRVKLLYVKKQFLNVFPRKLYAEVVKDITRIFPRKTEISILFLDIVGFTRFSQGKDPRELIELLSHQFYTPSTEIIFNLGGMVDKYLGDGIMAVFGDEGSVETAVQAAIKVFNKLKDSFPLGVSAGISYGSVVSGIVGSEFKKEFTVLGDPVNRASKLSKMAGPWEILLDHEAASNLKSVKVTPAPQQTLFKAFKVENLAR